MTRKSMVKVMAQKYMMTAILRLTTEQIMDYVLAEMEMCGMLPPPTGKGTQPIPDDCEWEVDDEA